MEGSRRRIRNLEPARPLRRLNAPQVAKPLVTAVEKPEVETVSGSDEVQRLFEILNLHNQNRAPAKMERISYSRDFLIRLASSPMAKTKPDFLPDHPVVLEKARDQDVRMLFVNNLNCKVDRIS